MGDAVLGLIITDILYHKYHQAAEGHLSRMRSNLVSSKSLVEVALRLGLSAYLLVGKCEVQADGSMRSSILSNAVEALIAAVYLDGGMSAARKVVSGFFMERLQQDLLQIESKDPKTLLQEWLQARAMPRPVYLCESTKGAHHKQLFKMSCSVEGVDHIELAEDTSRRKAEAKAAEQFLLYLEEHHGKSRA